VLMSLQPAIPRQVALLQCLPPLHRLDSMFHLPAGTVNHHLTRAGEFSIGITRNFQPEWTIAASRDRRLLPGSESSRVNVSWRLLRDQRKCLECRLEWGRKCLWAGWVWLD